MAPSLRDLALLFGLRLEDCSDRMWLWSCRRRRAIVLQLYHTSSRHACLPLFLPPPLPSPPLSFISDSQRSSGQVFLPPTLLPLPPPLSLPLAFSLFPGLPPLISLTHNIQAEEVFLPPTLLPLPKVSDVLPIQQFQWFPHFPSPSPHVIHWDGCLGTLRGGRPSGVT